MAPLPTRADPIATAIDAAQKQSPPRPHMGCSMAGHPCDRYLWLSFRWAVIEKFEGRMLRLFRRGHNEEDTILKDLVAAGVKIVTTQAPVDFGGHVSGSADAVIENVPGAEKTRHLAEFKTHSRKSFDLLLKDGVEKSKPQHYAQMQVYMLGLGLSRALYVAVCKDDDRIYTERVRCDMDAAKGWVARLKRLATDDRLPPPISTDPTWYQCRFCPAYNFCHQGKPAMEVNCRTCAQSTACENSSFHCEAWDSAIPVDAQRQGCWSHVIHPDLVPWEWVGGDEKNATYRINGREVVNGPDGHSTGELLGLSALDGPIGDALAAAFPGAEIVGVDAC